jgi:hypothetical protein
MNHHLKTATGTVRADTNQTNENDKKWNVKSTTNFLIW